MGYRRSGALLFFTIGTVILAGALLAFYFVGSDAGTGVIFTESTDGPTTKDAVENPWGKRTLNVSVDGNGYMKNSTEEAVGYWEKNVEEYTPHEVSFRMSDTDPDIVVESVDEIEACGHVARLSDALGCAPLINSSQAPDTAEVSIVSGYSENTTVKAIKHEIGHVLGLSHGDEPADTMSAESVARPRISGDEVNVEIEYDGENPGVVRSQVENTFEEFDRRFSVDPSGEADVLLRFEESTHTCGTNTSTEAGSCAELEDIDGDGTDEYSVSLSGLRLHQIEWHVGNWMSKALGVNSTKYTGGISYTEVRRERAQELDPREVERAVHEEVNEVRRENGMDTWRWEPELARIARDKSEEMAASGTVGPGDAFEDRYEEYGYDCEIEQGRYRYLGAENIGFGYYKVELDDGTYHSTPEELAESVVERWTRADDTVVLSDVWRNEGIGVDVGPEAGVYVTQNVC